MAEVLHIDIKNHVTTNKLIPNRHLFVFIQDLECNTYILYLLSDRILPEVVTVLFVKFKRMLCRLGHLDYKFMYLIEVTRTSLLYQINDVRPLFDHVRHPPIKGKLTV